jgi:archaellum component FlaG (FlaF/FlaG flagellin family)
MERQVLSSSQFYMPTPSSTTISSASSLKRNHIKTHFHKINNPNEIIEVSNNNHYFDLSINPTNSNNHITNTSFASLHQNNLLKNKSTMNSNSATSYKNPNDSIQCYPYQTKTSTTQRKTPMLNNSTTSNASDCNSSVLGHVGSTKYHRPTIHYHDDNHLDDSFKIFYNQDLNFPFVITSDDSTRQKQVKNFLPYQQKAKLKLK